ncbi:Transcriptional regulatory protein sin3 [Kappamyces sp. JEL0829]|nr:Transcriptional regulatory protein sin3 [Kappamyces sp. JEL0829]
MKSSHEVEAAGDNASQTSRGTTYTTRALGLLDSIRHSTTPEVNQEFLSVLAAFKRKQIDSKTTLKQVTSILKDYPALLQEFTSYLPEGSGSHVASPTKLPARDLEQGPPPEEQGPTQFSAALAFVNRVKLTYAQEPQVYETFLSLLRNYQRGLVAQKDVVVSVSSLLSATPELAVEFQKYYGSSLAPDEAMSRANSNDTIASTPPVSSKTPLISLSSAPTASVSQRETTTYGSTERAAETAPELPSQAPAKKLSPFLMATTYFFLFLIVVAGALFGAYSLGWLNSLLKV